MLGKATQPFVNTWQFLQDVRHELQRVVWPSHEDTWTFTMVVLITVLIVGAWIGILDGIFGKLIALLQIYR